MLRYLCLLGVIQTLVIADEDRSLCSPEKIMSYHIHVLADNTEKSRRETRDLRDEFVTQFPLGPCKTINFDTKTCVTSFGGPGGPFYHSGWNIHVIFDELGKYIRWMNTRIKNDMSYFIHPNYGCLVEDHSDWSWWLHDTRDINVDLLRSIQESGIDLRFFGG